MDQASTAYDFSLNPRPTASLLRVGREQEPVLQVDGLLARPERLVDFAAGEVSFAPAWGPGGGYPGMRAPAPLDYVRTVIKGLRPYLEQAFGLEGMSPAKVDCAFSLVTLPPDRLVPAQRTPHVDTSSPHQLALLHYLCDGSFGGTAFFRHRATGFETIKPERLKAYEHARSMEDGNLPAPDGYADEDGRFERIGGVDARWNRLVVYRSQLLHSGRIEQPETLSEDPRRGRLTANIFLTLGVPRG